MIDDRKLISLIVLMNLYHHILPEDSTSNEAQVWLPLPTTVFALVFRLMNDYGVAEPGDAVQIIARNRDILERQYSVIDGCFNACDCETSAIENFMSEVVEKHGLKATKNPKTMKEFDKLSKLISPVMQNYEKMFVLS